MAISVPQQEYYKLAEGVPLPRNDTSVQRPWPTSRVSEFQNGWSMPKQAGARGYFEVTDDISDVTDADFLTGIGKKTELLTRISTVGPERGSADTIRDFHGWAIKFKTAEGNNDWVFNNQPVFFIRDPIKFPSLNRSHKRHPVTNAADADMFWDFHINSPESIHALMFLFSDRGIPASLRNFNGYSGHTYKFTKQDGSYHYVKIHILSTAGIKTLTSAEANVLAGTHPDALTLSLFESIVSGNYPTYNVYIQTLHPSAVPSFPVNIFDMTKVWPHSLAPLRPVGKIVLDTNPQNYFAEIEQAAFSPGTMVPGIEPSADPMLQARMFAYPDAQRYRLGVNYQFLPTNAPRAEVYCPTERDGFMNFKPNYGGDPNYVGSRIRPVAFKGAGQNNGVANGQNGVGEGARPKVPRESFHDGPVAFTSKVTDEDFMQPRALWEVFGQQDGCQERFVETVAEHVSQVKREWLRKEVYRLFERVDAQLGKRITEATQNILDERQKVVAEAGEEDHGLTRHFSHVR